jgi:hypothetical protein
MATSNVVPYPQNKYRASVSLVDNLSVTRREFDRASEITGGRIGQVEKAIESLVSDVESIKKATERATPENIYDTIGADIQKEQPMLLKIRSTLRGCLEHLSKAQLYFSEEVVKETELDLYYGTVRRLSFLPFKSSSFEQALTLLLVTLEGHVSLPYSKNEIAALQAVTGMLADNPVMSEDVLEACIDTFEDAGFNLSAPFAGVDLNDSPE